MSRTSRRSASGGRHELGQNFLIHRPTVQRIASLVDSSLGPILELGAGNGVLTRALVELGQPVIAIDVDEHHVNSLRHSLPSATLHHADALRWPLEEAVIVGNIPFHLTTPILRRLLSSERWMKAVLLTQWEVARKRAGVGGGTMMTAQSAPWFEFELHGRVPSSSFRPQPSVDGGILSITRRVSPLVARRHRANYESFVRSVFTGRGRSLAQVLELAARCDPATAQRALARAELGVGDRPRDIDPNQWATLWNQLKG